MGWFKRVGDERLLTLSWLVAWTTGAVFGAFRNGAACTAFVSSGTFVLLARVFYSRMRGRTSMGPQGIETELAPPPTVSVLGPAGDAPEPGAQPMLSPSTLVARWPTLNDALKDIPTTWSKERIRHDDGQEYLHVRSPQAGYDLVVNVAALDSAAPRWLMVAIEVMSTT